MLNAERLEEVAEQLGMDQNGEAWTGWSEPVPIDSISLPYFPVEVFPDTVRRMVEATARVNQVDPGLPATIGLGVLSAAISNKCLVGLISHKEPCNLYCVGISPSGERKTSTLGEMAAPIFEYQAMRQDAMKATVREAANRYKALEKRLDLLQRKASSEDERLKREDLIRQANEVSKEMTENPVPTLPVLCVDDVTTEALGNLMAENGGRIANISPEGGIFKLMNGYYNEKGANLDLYLKGHAGDPLSCHRIGRGAYTIQKPALTFALAVQPDVIEEIGRNKQFKGRGLLARFLYTKCKSQVGLRQRQTDAMPQDIQEAYRRLIHSLLDLPDGIILGLESDAQTVWNEFYNDVEAQMRPGEPLAHIADWGSKLPGAVARMAGLLHLGTYGPSGIEEPISINIVTGACLIGAYFRDHALAVFGLMAEDKRIPAARKILEYLTRHKPGEFKGRDVLRHAYFSTMAELDPGLDILVERGYIRKMTKVYTGMGRPEAQAYELNPRVYMPENH